MSCRRKTHDYLISLILMWTPLSDLSTTLGVIFGLKAGSSISSYLFSVMAVTTFSSFMAKLWPMQFLCMNGTNTSNRIREDKSEHFINLLKMVLKVDLSKTPHLTFNVDDLRTNLGPAENGRNAYADLLATFSGRKRSGSKTCTNAGQTHQPQIDAAQPRAVGLSGSLTLGHTRCKVFRQGNKWTYVRLFPNFRIPVNSIHICSNMRTYKVKYF